MGCHFDAFHHFFLNFKFYRALMLQPNHLRLIHDTMIHVFYNYEIPLKFEVFYEFHENLVKLYMIPIFLV